jgi:glycosidase
MPLMMYSQSGPQWAEHAIWYQIFPERFRNGDPSNDPQMKDLAYADPQEPPQYWQVHPWGSDWYQLQDYEKANGEPELWKHLLRRRYGGDLQGIINQLDYLQDLGITAIYLNPIFQSPSLHKYDGESYHHVDPNFGPDPEGDRALIAKENPLDPESWVWTSADLLALQLIEEVHKRGMRIIFDGVFNHMGYNSFAFADVRKNQAESPYKDWFSIKSWDNPETEENEFDYEGWWGVKSLPEFKEDDNGLVEGPRNYVFAATARWMNPMGRGPEFGIDGWRLDVAFCVKHNFWKEWRLHVKSLNPEAYITAELVSPLEETLPYLSGDEFDAEMNYNWAFTCTEFFINPEGKHKRSPSEFEAELQRMREFFPDPRTAYRMQNLFGSHDVNRIGSHIVNRGGVNFRDWGDYFGFSKAADNREYMVRKPNTEELEIQKLFVSFQFTYLGAPMIYYGDEVGMWGGNDPDDRKPMLWSDINYEDEVYLPDQSKRKQADAVAPNLELRDFYKKMIAIRRAHPALADGEYRLVLADDDRNIFIFERWNAQEKLTVVINNASKAQDLNLLELGINPGTNLMDGKPSGESLKLKARSTAIILNP